MSYTTPSGEPRKPGEQLPAKGEPVRNTAKDAAPTPQTPPRRSAGAPKKSGTPRPGGKPTGKKKSAKGRPIAPVKVTQQRNWGSIGLFTVVGLLFVAIIGYGSWQAIQGSKTWQERALAISGVTDFTKTNEKDLTAGNGNHVAGRVEYFATPSVGGNHNPTWQNCMGSVYSQQIASEHATHSLEHGAVWITYDPATVSPSDVQELEKKVNGNDYTLMSPFPNQGSPISLQVWGYQLKVNSASDERIDEFIKATRLNASVEPGATCSGGTTATGIEPQGGPAAMPSLSPAAPTASPVG